MPGLHLPARGRVIIRDAVSGHWLRFERPRQIVTAASVTEVAEGLRRVEEAVCRQGLYAAGFVSYEAAPAFDRSLVVRGGKGFPLLWFGLYAPATAVDVFGGASRGDWVTPSGLQAGAPEWQASLGQAEFYRAIRRTKFLIRRGETYQVNYTYRLKASFAANPWPFFLQLLAAQEPPYGAYVDTGEWVICSASPELFFRLDGSHIESRPMKGTAARGRTLAEDRARVEALQTSEKERAENVMIVDMVRNDLGRIARTGSVKVSGLCELEKYPTVWQMTSTVAARTSAGLGEIFQALFPAASVTGAPKVRTMQIIADLERLPRRLYTGTVGFFAPGRLAQFNVAIRTLLVNKTAGTAEYGVGSGITWDSDPEAEWQECRAKCRILAAPTPAFRLLETMRWTPEEGYYLLKRHLARLQVTARYFGFRSDLPALRRDLKRLAVGFGRKARRIRILVERDGCMAIETRALPATAVAAAGLQRVALAAEPVDSSDPFLYHKTTNRAVYEAARAARPGFEDVLLFNERGEITESTIANVAVEAGGKLCTPPVSCGLLPGTLRAELLERGMLIERRITVAALRRARSIFLLNSVRGLYPVVLCPPSSGRVSFRASS